MADKEFTQICKEILAASEKISPLAEQAGKLVDRIEQAKEATEQNAASAKSAQQKAAEILASIEKLQEQIKATADKVENAGALLTELNSLKEQIKTLLQNGIINDEAQSATQTYSSTLIERKLETKASVGYGYSKIEANAKFDNLAQGINTAISAAAAAQSSAAGKLGKDEQAADSAKLGGAAADKYMKSDKYNPTAASSPNTLVLRDENGDFKGGRITAGNFLTTEKAQDDGGDEHSEICYRAAQSSEAEPKQMRFATLGKIISLLKVEAATEAKAGIVKLKNSIMGNLSDTAVSEKAAKEYMDKNASIGIGQTWQDVTTQRQYGVVYTNTTERPIMVYVRTASGSGVIVSLEVNGIVVATGGDAQGIGQDGINVIVPPNATYKLTGNGTGFGKWVELR
ncbi:hypothetical protein [uncultured Campylobacter sp.]|uniref:hypothetical protein n=1 Tax=uncultured Campylobacter sp. TaxID=218934 RepID=UPI00261202F7|nr:hypothetical protein [uncultured Campylobacter sp.]